MLLGAAGLGFAVPALSVAVLLVFFATFGAVWLLGWGAHLLIAPDGIALLQSILDQREHLNRNLRL